MNHTIATALSIFLGAFAPAYGQGAQGGYSVYGPDHEYHLLSRNQPFIVLRPRPYCDPQWNPSCNVLPPPGYPLEPLQPIGGAHRVAPPPQPPQPLTMEQDRERIIRQGEEHCRRWNDPAVCHENK